MRHTASRVGWGAVAALLAVGCASLTGAPRPVDVTDGFSLQDRMASGCWSGNGSELALVDPEDLDIGGPRSTPVPPTWSVPVPWTNLHPLLAADGVLLSVGRRGGGAPASVFAVDAASGQPLWQTNVGSRDGSPFGAHVVDGVVVLPHTERIRAYDLASGEQRWTFAPGGRMSADGVDGDIVSGAGLVLLADRSGALYALEAQTGDERWRAPVGDGGGGYQLITDDIVIVAGEKGPLQARELQTGAAVWAHELGEERALFPVHGVGSGRVLYTEHRLTRDDRGIETTSDPELVAVDVATGEPRWRRALDLLDDVPEVVVGDPSLYVHDGRDVVAVDALDGHIRWEWDLRPVSARVVYPVHGLLVVGTVDDEGAGELVAVDVLDGSDVWRARLPVAPTSLDLLSDDVLVVTGAAGSLDEVEGPSGLVAAVDPGTGELLWSRSEARAVQVPPVMVDQGLAVLTADEPIFCD